MQTTTPPVSTLRRLMQLTDREQQAVKQIADILLKVWPRPAMQTEQQLLFVDDLAKVFQDFGAKALEAAIDYLRQNSEYRPSIKAIRDACGQERSRSSTRIKSGLSPDMEEHYAELKRNPAEFVPLSLIVRDALALKDLKHERAKQGRPMTPQECQEWRFSRVDQTRREWAEMVRRGEHLPPQSVDVKRSAAGDLEPAFA